MKGRGSALVMITCVAAVALFAIAPAGAQTAAEEAELQADASAVTMVAPKVRYERIDCGGTAPQTFYFSDFEADDGGWTVGANGVWEHGAIVSGVGDGCDSAPTSEPTAAHSGSNVWATNLDGCYPNLGDVMTISQTFDFTNLLAPIELTWYDWTHVFGSFDFNTVYVNGTSVYSNTTSSVFDWQQRVVDLSAYAGNASVEIVFEVSATTVVNRLGWYVDDVSIEFCNAIPVELQSFSIE